MQMLVYIQGVGLGVSGYNVSANKGAAIFVRGAPDESPVAFTLYDAFALGDAGPNGVISQVTTEWFTVNISAHEWLFDTQELYGRYGELKISGSSLFGADSPRVDIDLTVDSKAHEVWERLEVRNVPVHSDSIQIGSSEVGGIIKRADEKLIQDMKRSLGELLGTVAQ